MRRDSIPPGLHWNAQLKRIQDVDFIYKYFSTVQRWSYIDRVFFQYNLHNGERISDTYKKGVQYKVLRESFRDYLLSNEAFVSTNQVDLLKAYSWALRKHQFKNVLVRITPFFIKNIFKRLIEANL